MQKIGLYQICFNKMLLDNVPSGMHPWDNSKENRGSKLREFEVFQDMFSQKIYQQYEYCGAVSSKFHEKTLIEPKTFSDWVTKNPGHDLYLINPFYNKHTKYDNVWLQGEAHHPHLIEHINYIFKNCFKMKLQIADFPKLPAEYWSYCNYWVGNKHFWEQYIPILNQIHHFCLTDDTYDWFAETTHEPAPAPMFSFIVERMITTFLAWGETSFQSKKIKFLSYPLP